MNHPALGNGRPFSHRLENDMKSTTTQRVPIWQCVGCDEDWPADQLSVRERCPRCDERHLAETYVPFEEW